MSKKQEELYAFLGKVARMSDSFRTRRNRKPHDVGIL